MDEYHVPILLDFLRGSFARAGLNPLVTRVKYVTGEQRFSVRVTEPFMTWVRANGLTDAVTGDLFTIGADALAVSDREDVDYLVKQRMDQLVEKPDIPSGLLWKQSVPEVPGRLPS